MFWCCQHKCDVNSKAKAAQPFLGVQGKWEQLFTPAAWCFPFPLICRTRAAIKACTILHHSLPPTKGNRLYPNEPGVHRGYFSSFKILLAVDYIWHLPWPVNSNLALPLALWSRCTCSLNFYKTQSLICDSILPAIVLPVMSHLLIFWGKALWGWGTPVSSTENIRASIRLKVTRVGMKFKILLKQSVC